MKQRAHHRRLHRRRTGSIDLTPAPPVAVPYAPPSADFVAIDQMTRAAERNGWPTQLGFEAAMHMRSAGIDTTTAVEAFEACGRWLQ
jgi:hypothetical protein